MDGLPLSAQYECPAVLDEPLPRTPLFSFLKDGLAEDRLRMRQWPVEVH